MAAAVPVSNPFPRDTLSLREIQSDNNNQHGVSFVKAATDRLGTLSGIKDSLKFFKQSVDWTKFATPNVPKPVAAVGKLAGDVKNGVAAAAELPVKSVEAVKSIVNMCQQRTAASVKDFVSKSTDVMGPVGDAVSLLTDKNIIKLSDATLSAVSLASSTCLGVGTAIGAGDQVYNIVQAYDQMNNAASEREKTSLFHKIAVYAINFFKFASYVCLGTIGVVAATTSLVIAPWIPLMFASSALFFSITGYFYEKMNGVNQR